MYEAVSTILVCSCILFASSILLLGLNHLYRITPRRRDEIALTFLLCVVNGAAAYALLPTYRSGVEVAFFLGVISLITLLRVYPHYSATGMLFYLSNIVIGSVGMLWGILFVLSLSVSFETKALLLTLLPLLFFTLPFGMIRMVEQFDVLCRNVWKRPKIAMRQILAREPMVSLHVPVYAEPPEIVIATLRSIAALQYHNYEVIVVDNNTKDEALWKPLEEACKELGPKFRFFHVDPLKGAKAGALNFALSQTAPNAEIVGVIDSDYQTDPNFIADLVAYFEDPKIGFVQTPHDYRDWESNFYLKMCYWEYKAFFHTILVALNERDAALTIGTMCLVRKQALIEAGGWAMWCLTEDSELSIRIHDKGYSSVYVERSYGRGLIPETFEEYVKQRFRWIAGPVQEFKYHARHLLGLTRTQSGCTPIQRVHHLHHGFSSATFGLNIPFLILSLLITSSMVVHQEVIAVPFALWASVTLLFFSNVFLEWLQYRVILKTSLKEMCMGLLANKALSFAATIAAFQALFYDTIAWRRTNKFKHTQSLISCLVSVRVELTIGTLLLCFSATMFYLMPFSGLLTMCLIGILYKSFDYFAAPVVAVIAWKSQNTALS